MFSHQDTKQTFKGRGDEKVGWDEAKQSGWPPSSAELNSVGGSEMPPQVQAVLYRGSSTKVCAVTSASIRREHAPSNRCRP